MATLPPEEQIKRVMEKLKQLNPQMEDKVNGFKIKDNQVHELAIYGKGTTNLAPLHALPGLQILMLNVASGHEQPGTLEGLQGMSLSRLELHNVRLKDLSPLQGMRLVTLDFTANPVTDISVLKTLPALKHVKLHFNAARDEAVLRSLPGLQTINGQPVEEFWKSLPAAETTFTNSLGMEFVRVAAGKSWLGGGGGKPGTQQVEIKEDFYLGKFEVTQGEWQKVMGTTPSHFSRTGGGSKQPFGTSSIGFFNDTSSSGSASILASIPLRCLSKKAFVSLTIPGSPNDGPPWPAPGNF